VRGKKGRRLNRWRHRRQRKLQRRQVYLGHPAPFSFQNSGSVKSLIAETQLLIPNSVRPGRVERIYAKRLNCDGTSLSFH
jgi:hypothetical protein